MTKKSNIFREYDIRGIYNVDLQEDMVFSIGAKLADILKVNAENSVAIGYDARTHSPILFKWLSDGFASHGIKVYNLGQIPTPVAYFATFSHPSIKSSVMITGSHNPPEYNGFKITLNNKPFYGKDIQDLGQKILSNPLKYAPSTQEPEPLDALDSYIKYLTEHFSHLKNFPYKIVLDAGNGVGAIAMEPILKNLNISYEALFFEPDGTFPNHHPDPSVESNLAILKQTMKNKNINIGIAFDGDADRVALLSTNYSYKGDELAILFAKKMKKDGISPLVIGEVKCSQVMYDEINKIGKSVMYKTGHSNLKVKLKELNAHLAAEMSGHMFFNDRYFGYDDALYAALRCLELFVDGVEIVEKTILSLPKTYSTSEEKIEVSEDGKFQKIQNLKDKLEHHLPSGFPKIVDIVTIDGLRVIFEHGWGLVRASNTTPVLVTRFEANSQENVEIYKNALLSLLKD